MSKSPDAFRTISEVAEWLGVQAHVLRFWESKFAQVKPVKRAGGRRYYRPADMKLLGGIRTLLYDDGLTIKGVQKIIREQGVAHVSSLSHSPEDGPREPAGEVVQGTVVSLQDRRKAPPAEPEQTQLDLGGQAEAQTEEPAALDATSLPRFLQRALEPDDHPPQQEVAQDEERPQFADQPPQDEPPADLTAEDPSGTQPETPAETPAAAPIPILPDPPPEAEIAAAPGALSHLVGIDRITPAQAREIAPLARALRQWHDRAAGI